MLNMSNLRLVEVLRSAVLSPDRVGRFTPRPPKEYDAYVVSHGATSICITFLAEGAEVFRCRFVEAEQY